MDARSQDLLGLASASRRLSTLSTRHADFRASITQASSDAQASFSHAPGKHDAKSSLATHIEPNAFEESFAEALDATLPGTSASKHESGVPLGAFSSLDGQQDAEEHGPLLGHEDHSRSPASSESLATVIRIPIHATSLVGPRSKSKASRAIYLSHEVCHSSQYTRPAADILRDLLEIYPPTAAHAGGRFARDGSEAELGLLSGQPDRKKQWWKRVFGMV